MESECKEDMARALELKKIVDSAFKPGDEGFEDFNILDRDKEFDDSMVPGFVTIKIKESHSKWYKSFYGKLHYPSLYHTMVPKSVAKEAVELQNIRRKHQGDPNFDFFATDYKKKIVREADHDNDGWF